jgi:hypothetical protein
MPLLSKALSRDNAPLKVPYLLAHTSDWGVLERSRIWTHSLWPYPSWLLVPMSGRRFKCPGPSPTLGSLGPSHQWRHKSQVSLQGPPCVHGVGGTPYGEVRDRHPRCRWCSLNIVGLLVVSWRWCGWRCVWLQVFCLGLAENQSVVYVAPFVN